MSALTDEVDPALAAYADVLLEAQRLAAVSPPSRAARLEEDPLAWFSTTFPHVASADFAPAPPRALGLGRRAPPRRAPPRPHQHLAQGRR